MWWQLALRPVDYLTLLRIKNMMQEPRPWANGVRISGAEAWASAFEKPPREFVTVRLTQNGGSQSWGPDCLGLRLASLPTVVFSQL